MKKLKMIVSRGFTLAEVLITLAIIGIVAAISIPSVVSNTQQQEFKTGLRKAVSVLNSAITMNIALDGESPYDNYDLYTYLQRHMSVMRSMVRGPRYTEVGEANAARYFGNFSFYTTDGMRFEFVSGSEVDKYVLHENPNIKLREPIGPVYDNASGDSEAVVSYNTCENEPDCARCGSYGLNSNTDETTNAPCLVIVDVNGDRKPYPSNSRCFSSTCSKENIRKYADPDGIRLTDTFPIMITDKGAIPYGTAAQRAMYQGQKGK